MPILTASAIGRCRFSFPSDVVHTDTDRPLRGRQGEKKTRKTKLASSFSRDEERAATDASFSCKRKRGRAEECSNKKEKETFFFKTQLFKFRTPSAAAADTDVALLFFLSFFLIFQKYPTEQHTHGRERETIYDPSLNPTVCVFSASAGFFPLNRQLKILFFFSLSFFFL